jgi:rhodanese-related sulfurtransferase
MNNTKRLQSKKTAVGHIGITPILIFILTSIVVTGGVCGAYFGYKNGFAFHMHTPVRTIDPLRMIQMSGEMQIVDIRSENEYKKGHIKNAISLPTYTIADKKLSFMNTASLKMPKSIIRTKPVVLYGPTAHFTQTNDSAERFASNGFQTMTLSVGWNEFRHFQNMWIPEALWGVIDVNSYIVEN